jgi:hypothetical protein
MTTLRTEFTRLGLPIPIFRYTGALNSNINFKEFIYSRNNHGGKLYNTKLDMCVKTPELYQETLDSIFDWQNCLLEQEVEYSIDTITKYIYKKIIFINFSKLHNYVSENIDKFYNNSNSKFYKLSLSETLDDNLLKMLDIYNIDTIDISLNAPKISYIIENSNIEYIISSHPIDNSSLILVSHEKNSYKYFIERFTLVKSACKI